MELGPQRVREGDRHRPCRSQSLMLALLRPARLSALQVRRPYRVPGRKPGMIFVHDDVERAVRGK